MSLRTEYISVKLKKKIKLYGNVKKKWLDWYTLNIDNFICEEDKHDGKAWKRVKEIFHIVLLFCFILLQLKLIHVAFMYLKNNSNKSTQEYVYLTVQKMVGMKVYSLNN